MKWHCPNRVELVTADVCKKCNREVAIDLCGCCDFVRSGKAPFTCSDCEMIQIKFRHGNICLDPTLSPEENGEIIMQAVLEPEKYFSC